MDNIQNYTVIDLEMTGLSAKNDKIIEIGAAKIRNGELSEKYQTLVDPKIHIPEREAEASCRIYMKNCMTAPGARSR